MATSTEPYLTAGLAGLTAFAVAFALTPWVRGLAVRFGWVSKPVGDRWGRRAIARFGGVAMFLGFLGAVLAWVPLQRPLPGLLAGVTLVFLLGLADDVRRMRPYTKLIAQLLIGCLMVISGVRIEIVEWPWLAVPLSVLWFVLVMNAFNLLDNMDGLSAGIGALAAGFFAWHAAIAQEWTVMSLGLILCGSCLGFLRYNFPPAKIYMGDSGSHFIGLTLAAVSLVGTWHHSTQLISILLVPTLLLAVPIFDTCFVTVQRLLHHQHPFVGGVDHVSHRLAILGLSTRQTVVALYAAGIGLGLLSIVSATMSLLTNALLWLLVLVVLLLVGRYLSQVQVYRTQPLEAAGQPAESAPPVTVIETMLFHKRRLIEVLVDFILISSAYVFAHLLRFEGVLDHDLQRMILQSLPIILVVKMACGAGCGLYRGIWRYLGLSDVMTIFKAVTLGSILSAVALLFLWRFEGYSRAVLVIDWLLTFFFIASSRVVERLLNEWIGGIAPKGVPVLILGAGDSGARVLATLKYESVSSRRVIGFLDDDPAKLGSRIGGRPVLGPCAMLAAVVDRYQVRDVIVAISDPRGELLEQVRECCEPRGVLWQVVSAELRNVG